LLVNAKFPVVLPYVNNKENPIMSSMFTGIEEAEIEKCCNCGRVLTAFDTNVEGEELWCDDCHSETSEPYLIDPMEIDRDEPRQIKFDF